ncbi:hypothetical protein EIA23_19375, partial [Escherichia coli]
WLMMSLWDALRMNMMISYQELVRTFLSSWAISSSCSFSQSFEISKQDLFFCRATLSNSLVM